MAAVPDCSAVTTGFVVPVAPGMRISNPMLKAIYRDYPPHHLC
jgi:hypothetical protein